MPHHNKIFCIGLSRTGTTSISCALSVLGYNVVHYPTEILFNDFLFTRKIEGSIPESWDGISDTHACVFYKEFDKAYPNSKFILTTRNKDEWLKSMQKHLTVVNKNGINQLSAMVVYLTSLCYGCLYYNKEHFSKVWDNYHQEVKEYFCTNKNNFLEFPLEKTDKEKWESLCLFLNEKEIPNQSFPQSDWLK